MKGEISGIALEIKTAGGGRLPVLVSSVVKYSSENEPLLIRTTVFDASDRRSYEQELLRRKQGSRRGPPPGRGEARKQAEADRARLQGGPRGAPAVAPARFTADSARCPRRPCTTTPHPRTSSAATSPRPVPPRRRTLGVLPRRRVRQGTPKPPPSPP
ncbi:hypothetical protein LV779_12400 [Streptomyces thinghirensis]|nr:hypothetical protein [Streptomyces thinghirensis]